MIEENIEKNAEDTDNKTSKKKCLKSTNNDYVKHPEDETEDIRNQKKETPHSEQTKDPEENGKNKTKKESQVENSPETINSDNLWLEETNKHLQQTVQELEAQTKVIVLKKSELRYNNEKYLKNSNSSVNFTNNGLSQIKLITDPKPIAKFAPHWKQLMAAMGPYLMIFSAGLSSGFSATLLPQLKQEQSVILINKDSPSWIASMAALPMAPGCLIGGWLMEKLGRRYTLCALSIPFFVGWILIANAQNLTLMLMGRFLNGISIGLLAPPMSVFISEMSTPKLRGMFLAFLSFFIAVGIFVAHLIGTWISWQWTATICSIFPLLSAVLLIFVPESPVWLFSKGKTDDAIKSFYWLRGYDDEVEAELNALIDKYKSVETSPSERLGCSEQLKQFNTLNFFRPLFIVITIYLTCQFAGVHVITFYSVDIIETAVGEGIDHYFAMLTIDFLRVITTLVTCLASRNCPRRTLCFISGSLTTLSMAGLSMFLYFIKDNIPSHLTAVPLCFLSAYIIAINIGLMPLPWIIVGEIFPARFRSTGAGLASAIGFFSTFVVVKSAPGMMLNLGQVATFMFYGIVSLVGTIVLYFILPETKGKNLLEIESMFKRNKVKSNP